MLAKTKKSPKNTKKGFVCLGGCKGFSEKAKSCDAKECQHYGRPLKKGFKCFDCRETFLKKHYCKC